MQHSRMTKWCGWLGGMLTLWCRTSLLQAADQVLNWTSPSTNAALVWGRAYPLEATASSGLPVTFQVASGPASITDGLVTATNAGIITLVAEQAGDPTYAPVKVARILNQPIASTERLGGYATSGSALKVQVVRNLAYVAEGGAGMEILDVSDATALKRLGGYDTTGRSYWLQVQGSRAYVADDYEGLQILDVSNPAAPRRLGSYQSGRYYARGVQVVGEIAYLAGGPGGLQILDVSNPAAPKRLGYYSGSGTLGVQVVGKLAYVAGGSAGGLHILDVSSPAAPLLVGSFGTDRQPLFPWEFLGVLGVQVVDSVAYLASGSRGLQILDVANPATPKLLGGILDRNITGGAREVQLVGTVAYVADDMAGLQVVDVSDPAAPKWLGGHDTSGRAYSVQAKTNRLDAMENLVYVADEAAGLQIIRVRLGLPQKLPFNLPLTVSITNSPVNLNATAASGLPASIRVVSGPAEVVGDQLRLAGIGTVVVRVEQLGNEQFLAATAEVSIAVVGSGEPLTLGGTTVPPDGQIRFDLSGSPGSQAIIEFSHDLRAWARLSTNSVPATLTFQPGTGLEPGFYRAVLSE